MSKVGANFDFRIKNDTKFDINLIYTPSTTDSCMNSQSEIAAGETVSIQPCADVEKITSQQLKYNGDIYEFPVLKEENFAMQMLSENPAASPLFLTISCTNRDSNGDCQAVVQTFTTNNSHTPTIKTSTLIEIGIVIAVVFGGLGFVILLVLYLRRKNDDAIANPGAHLPPGYSLAPPPPSAFDDDGY